MQLGLLVQYIMHAIRSTIMYADPSSIAIKGRTGITIHKPRLLLLLNHSTSVTGKETFKCSHVKKTYLSNKVIVYTCLKQNKSHGFGPMHPNEIIKTNN